MASVIAARRVSLMCSRQLGQSWKCAGTSLSIFNETSSLMLEIARRSTAGAATFFAGLNSASAASFALDGCRGVVAIVISFYAVLVHVSVRLGQRSQDLWPERLLDILGQRRVTRTRPRGRLRARRRAHYRSTSAAYRLTSGHSIGWQDRRHCWIGRYSARLAAVGIVAVTIKDIARQAGVSTATVSKVLNRKDSVIGDEIRQRVLSLARELNYTPNSLARSLVTRKSHVVGFRAELSRLGGSVLRGNQQPSEKEGEYALIWNRPKREA